MKTYPICKVFSLLLVLLMPLLVSCSSEPEVSSVKINPFVEATGVPLGKNSDGGFSGTAESFLLPSALIINDYSPTDAIEATNERVLELRQDGQSYIAATGRISGWQIQFQRFSQTNLPPFIINVVNIYETPAGPSLALSREWHGDVWSRIDSGEFTLLAAIPGLQAEHLVWQDASGSIGVEIAYRNLYILLTGPTDAGDQYGFFAELARTYVEWIRARE